jgi:hypothetical protein
MSKTAQFGKKTQGILGVKLVINVWMLEITNYKFKKKNSIFFYNQ